jgi:hypothetical protein
MLLALALFVEIVPAACVSLKKMAAPANGALHVPPPVHCALLVHGVPSFVPPAQPVPRPFVEKQLSVMVSDCAPVVGAGSPKLVSKRP